MTEFSNAERAQVLTQAIPYIQQYVHETVVIKYGGNAMVNESLKQQVMEDIVLLHTVGVNVVLVHGGGPDINDLMNRLGKKPEFVNGLRVTDEETIEIAQMVLAGKVNKDLVKIIQAKGAPAIGLSGIDGRMLKAQFKNEELGFVGEIIDVNVQVLRDVMEKGYVPVISTIASNKDAYTYNINGDTAAGVIAGALKAKRLIMLTDTEGVLLDKDNPGSLLPKLTINECEQLKKDGVIVGGMIPKVDCCCEAVKSGVESVVITDGRVPHSILMELFTDEGAGTMIVSD